MMTSGERNEARSVARGARLVGAIAAAAALALAGCSADRGVYDPANELPFGHVDAPIEGAQVDAKTPLAGWAMDDRGIRQIRLYVDNHLVNTGPLTQDRPDVSKIYPRYTHADHRHGFSLLMGFDAPGRHVVVVQAVDSDGATRDIGVLTVTSVDK